MLPVHKIFAENVCTLFEISVNSTIITQICSVPSNETERKYVTQSVNTIMCLNHVVTYDYRHAPHSISLIEFHSAIATPNRVF